MDITLPPKCESGGHYSTGAIHSWIIRSVSYGRGHLIGMVMCPFMTAPTFLVLPTSLGTYMGFYDYCYLRVIVLTYRMLHNPQKHSLSIQLEVLLLSLIAIAF